MCQDCGCSTRSGQKIVEVQRKVLEANDKEAGHNREMLDAHSVIGINLMSSPGSGKTTLLERTIEETRGIFRVGVIEGDLETDRDAERIRAKGVPVLQITTGQACHLDAFMLHEAMHSFHLEELDLLFVENVGNLVCPATYELGTHLNVVLLSVSEGDDKPAKYPIVFRNSRLMLVTKTDQLAFSDFDIEKAVREAQVINPDLEVIRLSAKTGEGFGEWIDYLRRGLKIK